MDYKYFSDNKICPVCNSKASIIDNYNSQTLSVSCNLCGEYEITRELIEDDFAAEDGKYDLFKLKSYLYYNNLEPTNKIFSQSNSLKNFVRVSPQTVENWYPKTFAEKTDLILLKLYQLSKYEGYPIFIQDEALFLKNIDSSHDLDRDRENQKEYILNFLVNYGFLEKHLKTSHILMPKALQRIYELQKMNSANKDVFVSMAFNDSTVDTREAIRKGVEKSGFCSKFIDEIIHNHQIMPEMFRLIRECKFLILEISDPNYGAYYEAGYALGLGKEVIICCKKEVFDKEYITEEEKKYAKYLKPHFDIAQKQILVWTDYQDLIKKLSEWIKALIH